MVAAYINDSTKSVSERWTFLCNVYLTGTSFIYYFIYDFIRRLYIDFLKFIWGNRILLGILNIRYIYSIRDFYVPFRIYFILNMFHFVDINRF